jgi:hypothetical protein
LPAAAQDDEAIGFERTPPRLSYLDGEVSFLRPGADDWTPARVNTALAAGDELYAPEDANLELQIGARAFARAGERTQLALTSLEPDFLQLRVTEGHVSLDLRSLKTGQTFEIDTPNAAFVVERSGYYRVEVDGETSTFTSRRGGRATVTPASGDAGVIVASEQVVVTGTDEPQVETYAAPELDAWDRWNYARTDEQLDAVSARYVPSDVYGVDDLDRHGDWRVVPDYGAVWLPRHVPVGWAPYSSGRWLFDPYYGWTWVDDAPWGWAPYHYGRWVHVSGYWGWCPGPIVRRPYYAPALVAFFGGGGFSIGITFGRLHIGWVALGWGEPLVPWWGPPRFRGHPRWAGWGGPRVVNNVVVKRETIVNVKQINVYQNARVRDAVVAVDRDHFGRRSRDGGQFTRARHEKLEPLHGGLDVKPDRSSLVAEDRPAKRPPRELRQRSVVATREPRIERPPEIEERRAPQAERPPRDARGSESGAPDAPPPPRVVSPPRKGERIATSKRPPFGTQSEVERRPPPPPPRFKEREAAEEKVTSRAKRSSAKSQEQRSSTPSERPPAAEREKTRLPREESREEPQAEARVRREAPPPRPTVRDERLDAAKPERSREARPERASLPARELPGEPASRVYRRQDERRGSISSEPEHAVRGQTPEQSRSERPREGSGKTAPRQRDKQRVR